MLGAECRESYELSTTIMSDLGLSPPDVLETTIEWEPTPMAKDSLGALNTFLRNSQRRPRSVSPIRSQLKMPLEEASVSTRCYYNRKARQVIETVLECIAPGQSLEFLNEVAENFAKNVDDSSYETQETLQRTLITLYNEAESWYTRRQILSLLVDQHSKSELQEMIPGLTVWRIDQARKHAKNEGAGKQVNIPTLYRTRLDHFKVGHFLDFISSPIYHQDVAFGTKKVKLTNETIEIPNMVRTAISSRIVSLYQSYCQENNFESLGKSTLFAILKVGYYYRSDYRSFDIIMLIFFMISFQACPASKKKSLSGLDNVATEGSLAFDALQNILEILGQKGIHTIIKITPLSKVYFLIILHCDLQVHPLTGSQTQEAGCTVARII